LQVTFWQFDKPAMLPFQTIEGDLYLKGARFGIVVSRFNAFITERLLLSAIDALRRTGTSDNDIAVVRVPGAFEVPVAARTLALGKKRGLDAVICLGLLLRGETSNYEHIAAEVARGIGQAAQDSGKPCTYGVLTCDTLEQAIDRAGLKLGNKGFEAAITAVEMVSLARKLAGKRRK
jgi:6,7-dimethyl-8-ribityllumazine synthase